MEKDNKLSREKVSKDYHDETLPYVIWGSTRNRRQQLEVQLCGGVTNNKGSTRCGSTGVQLNKSVARMKSSSKNQCTITSPILMPSGSMKIWTNRSTEIGTFRKRENVETHTYGRCGSFEVQKCISTRWVFRVFIVFRVFRSLQSLESSEGFRVFRVFRIFRVFRVPRSSTNHWGSTRNRRQQLEVQLYGGVTIMAA